MFTELNYLKIFFEEPEKEFHLREIARIFKKNPVTIKKYLHGFVKSGILSLKKERGFFLYSSNSESENYKELKKHYNREKLINSEIIDLIKKEFNLPTIIIFGSFERGEDNKNSDIDVCIISEEKKEINKDLKKYEKILNRNIQLHIFTKKQFKELKTKNPGLFSSVINGSKLYGLIEI